MSCFINNTSENGVNQFAPFSIIAKPVGSTCNIKYLQKTRLTIFRKNVIAVNGKSFVTEDAKKTGLFRVYLVKNQSIICVKGTNIFLNIQLRLCSS